MPTERLRSRDGENQQSDGQHRPSSSSQRTFDLSRINAERNYANSVQSGENTGKREYNPNTERSIDERGKLIENQIPLATNYGKDNPGLKGGRGASEYFQETGELHLSDWNRLERKLLKIKSASQTLKYVKEELEEGEEYNEYLFNAALRNRECTGEKVSKYIKKHLYNALHAYGHALEYYQEGEIDNAYIEGLRDHAPDASGLGVESSLGMIEEYKQNAPR
jgi:hypothetical protein